MGDVFGKQYAVAVCLRPAHLVGQPAHGSIIMECPNCGHPIWVAPSTRQAIERNELRTRLLCCCCSGVHGPADFNRPDTPGPYHAHDWSKGDLCECGVSRKVFGSETEGLL